MVSVILLIIQLAVSIVVGLYFIRQLRKEARSEPTVQRESSRELDKLRRMRSIHLSEPLAERVRPASLTDVIGQEDGIRSLCWFALRLPRTLSTATLQFSLCCQQRRASVFFQIREQLILKMGVNKPHKLSAAGAI